jgi:hypothetical protein
MAQVVVLDGGQCVRPLVDQPGDPHGVLHHAAHQRRGLRAEAVAVEQVIASAVLVMRIIQASAIQATHSSDPAVLKSSSSQKAVTSRLIASALRSSASFKGIPPSSLNRVKVGRPAQDARRGSGGVTTSMRSASLRASRQGEGQEHQLDLPAGVARGGGK